MRTVTENCSKPYALIGHADGLPYAALGRYGDGGPACVAIDGWTVSVASGGGIEGHKSTVFKALDIPTARYVRHPELDDKLFPSHEAACRAQYEAGVIAYFVYLDSPLYTRAVEIIEAGTPGERYTVHSCLIGGSEAFRIWDALNNRYVVSGYATNGTDFDFRCEAEVEIDRLTALDRLS